MGANSDLTIEQYLLENLEFDAGINKIKDDQGIHEEDYLNQK